MKEIKFKVNNIEWTIEIVEYNDENLKMEENDYRMSVTHYNEAKIYVQKEVFDSDESLIRTILMHEITHAYELSYGMLQVFWDNEIVADFIGVHGKSILETYYEIMGKIMAEENKKKYETGSWDWLVDKIENHIPRID